jgi:pilus assembly protein CpaF
MRYYHKIQQHGVSPRTPQPGFQPHGMARDTTTTAQRTNQTYGMVNPTNRNQPTIPSGGVEPLEEQRDYLEETRQKVNQALINVQGLLDRKDTEEGKAEIKRIISQTFYNAADLPYSLRKNANFYIEAFIHDICGFGPIQPLLNNPNITEIKVNGPLIIRIEENGAERTLEEIRFRDREHLMDIIQRIVSPIGREVNIRNPIEDAFLPDGSRVNIIIDPIAVKGPYLTIRKFVPQLTIEELCRRGAFTEDIIPVLEATAKCALNTCVSGGTGGGKTTLLNAIARFIPATESLITIEDTLELDLHHPDVRSLLTRPAGFEGTGEITATQLVKASLRMKPKRIIVGEARDSVIDDCLAAMNTGHPGSMFSAHANSPEELPERVEFMSEKPRESILSAFGKTMNMVYQVNQLPDGRRRMTHIAQICGYQNGNVVVENLFEFDHDQDRLVRTNVPFRYEKQMRDRRIEIPSILAMPVGGRYVG